MNSLNWLLAKHPECAGYVTFLQYASVPRIITADLLYKMWLRFNKEVNCSPLVVSDLILSGVVRLVTNRHFRIEDEYRARLTEKMDMKTKKAIAVFLLDYIETAKSLLSVEERANRAVIDDILNPK